MRKFITFFKYNNTFTVILGVLFLGFGGALAASPDLRENIVSSEEKVVSVDNTYIANVDLTQYSPHVSVVAVTEDDVSYYVTYTLSTIDISFGVWKELVKEKDITVPKKVLDGRDLGLYINEELKEVVDSELAYLKEVQSIEKKVGVTQKVVATAYSGLIGKLLTTKEESFAGYTPVIAPQSEPEPVFSVSVPSSSETQQPSAEGVSSSDTIPPTLTVQGNNPAEIARGASYSDLGVLVSDNVNNNLGITMTLNGVPVSAITIDTSKDGTHTVVYSATDQAGNTGTATRTIIVGTGVNEVITSTSAPEEIQAQETPVSESATSTPPEVLTSTSTPSVIEESVDPAPVETEENVVSPATTTPAN